MLADRRQAQRKWLSIFSSNDGHHRRTIIFLKRRLRYFHWAGMLTTVFGLVLVGAKSIFNSGNGRYTAMQSGIGIALVLLGAATSAAQMIVEELYMQRHGYHPLQAVGLEGIFGTIFMGVLILPMLHFIPGSDLNGSYENFLDAIYQLGSNGILLLASILYLLSMAWFNYFGFAIAKSFSTVHRTLVDALRTAFVWIIGLVLYYSVGSQYGEPFDVGWGLIQLDGFALLIIGTLIYNEVLRFPPVPKCFRAKDARAEWQTPVDGVITHNAEEDIAHSISSKATSAESSYE